MEKIKVVRAIPGILNVGDVLISPITGADFNLEETEVSINSSTERYVSLDYVTVSENVPQYFEFELDYTVVADSECYKCGNCEDCGCTWTKKELEEQDINFPTVTRTPDQINSRYNFFIDKANAAKIGSEEHVVYQNLIWLIDWLRGDAEIIN
jgi:hypothetical protein